MQALRRSLHRPDEERLEALVFTWLHGARAQTAPPGRAPEVLVVSTVSFAKYLKALARVTKTFSIEAGPFRAQGVPAVLVAATGIVAAAGVARALVRSSDRLPETLSEARALVQTLRNDKPQLRP